MMDTPEKRITQYLAVGGLFNPEMMEHDKVRDLLLDCRDELRNLRIEISILRDALAWRASRHV